MLKSRVVTAIPPRLRASGRAFIAVAHNRNLVRLQLSFGAGWTAEWAFTVALGVVAFRQGGVAAVGLVSFLRLAPPALIAPLTSTLADRFRRERVLIWSAYGRAAATTAAALVLVGNGPIAATYGLAVLASCAFVVFRAANSALLPALCGTPLELISATASRGLVDSVSTLLGPLIAALLLGIASPAAAFAAVAALSLSSALLLMAVAYEPPPRAAPRPLRELVGEAADGFRALRRYRDAGFLISLTLVQTFTRGCLTVFLVAIAFDLLDSGQVGVGVLTAAVGVGATVGSVGALMLVSGRRLAVIQGIGVALWGLPLALSGALPDAPLIFLLLGVVGVGNALVDVGLFALLARLLPEMLLGRVYGTMEGLASATLALGSLITPLVIAVAGLRGALVVLGLIAPAVVVAGWRRLRRIDSSVVHRDHEIAVLQQVGMLEALPMPMIDNLAAHLTESFVPGGTDVVHQGDLGELFYVIDDGEADVIGDGRLIRTLRPGDCFGEIALLRDSPRTATVRARTPLRLYTLNREDFLLGIGAYSASRRGADSLLAERLATFTPGSPPTGQP
ncbi:MAG TPA: MFS transporter [Candidatus Dormibacteraeota bacterium]|nr:MFS transporter [Candidatus Dormibacteraeota bacterium]